MKAYLKSLSFAFSAGCIGALFKCLAEWSCSTSEVTNHFNVKLNPTFSLEWLYPRIIWGGLWAFLFLLPYLRRSYFFRGLLYSLIPSAVTILFVLPFCDNQGFMGAKLGDLTPIFILSYNAIWGITSGLWLQVVEKG